MLISSIFLGAFGQIFMSVAMKAQGPVTKAQGLQGLFQYYLSAGLSLPMFGAVFCYGLSFVLWLGVLSAKDLSLARPLMSIGYIVTLAYGFYAGENVTWARALGTALIVIGLFFVVRSDKPGKKMSLMKSPTPVQVQAASQGSKTP